MSLFTKKIFSFRKPPFGLDLSDLSIKIIELKKGTGRDKVISFSCYSTPPGCIVDGEILKKNETATAIKEAIKRAVPGKIKTRDVICSLPETKAFLRLVSIPKMEEEETREAIKWEMEANIPLPIDQVYYDWQVLDSKISKDSTKSDILVVAVARKVVDQFLEVLEKAGLNVVGMEIESIAQARAFLSEKDKKTTTLITDLGDRRTSFVISVGNIPTFTCSVPLSAQSITDAISKGLNVSFQEAEKIKINSGIGSIIHSDPIFCSVRPVLETLAGELEKSIDFYQTGLGYSKSVDRIIVCGGGANTKGIIPFLSQRLGRSVELGNPWTNVNIGHNLPIIEREKSVQFSTAIGLALKGIYYEDIH
jgi:type IV pilus assembly protein PilM